VTAGASAPETVVEETIAWIKERHDTEVEPVMVREENVNFPLPWQLPQIRGTPTHNRPTETRICT